MPDEDSASAMNGPTADGAKEVKERIVIAAEQLASSEDWERVGRRYRDLKDALRTAPSLGAVGDRAYERRFNAARQFFYDNRTRASASTKARLAERARRLASHDNLAAARDGYKDMRRRWPSIGAAGAQDIELRAQFDAAGDVLWAAARARWRKRIDDRWQRQRERLRREEGSYDARLASGTDFARRVYERRPGPGRYPLEDRLAEIDEDLRVRGNRISELKRQIEELRKRLQD